MSVVSYCSRKMAPGKKIAAAGQNNPVAKIRFSEGLIYKQKPWLFKMPAVKNTVKCVFIFG